MSVITEHEAEWLYGLRWFARICSVASISMILLFFFGEEFNPSKITAKQWIGFLFFPIGIVVGMIIAWRHEGIGGTISVLSLLGFYLVYGLLLNNRLWQGGWFIVFTIPGILFFIYWLIFHFTLDRVTKH
jgi:hypothetical protein